jgi:hypothetical protein
MVKELKDLTTESQEESTLLKEVEYLLQCASCECGW